MITDLWIENFKGIGKRQHIPLRPITLLFGANSAGKSTVLHALFYLREIVCHLNPDPTKSMAGTQTVNLGGFWNLIHQPGGNRLSIAATVNSWCEVYNESHYVAANSRYLNNSQHIDISRHRRGAGSGVACHEMQPPVTIEVCIESAATIGLEYTVESVKVFSCWAPRNRDVSAFPFVESQNRRPWVPSKTGWINPWSSRFYPESVVADHGSDLPGNEAQHVAIDTDADRRDRFHAELSAKLQVLYSDPSSVVEAPRNSARFVFSASVLDVPSHPVEISREMFGNLAAFVPLSEFLEIVSRGEAATSGDWIGEDLSGLFVWLVKTDEGDGEVTIQVVGLLATVEGTLPFVDAISLLRVTCIDDPLVGALEIDHGTEPIPSTEQPLDLWGDRVLNPSEGVLCYLSERQALIDELVRGSLKSLKNSLNSTVYVGPKRSTVPRTLNSDIIGEHSDWGDGLGAWNWMLGCSNRDLETCGTWLCDSGTGLGTGFSLRRQVLYEVEGTVLSAYLGERSPEEFMSEQELEQLQADIEHSRSFRKIYLLESRTNRNRHPQDVGEGITQVIPVVAALVRSSSVHLPCGTLTGIEQPELHLHPSLAARIGDLVVCSSVTNAASRVLIETHSEHLILRILRRIRQTTNGELPKHIPPVKPDDVCVLWVDNLGDGTTFTRLRISDNGRWLDRWPGGFFTERHEELFDVPREEEIE